MSDYSKLKQAAEETLAYDKKPPSEKPRYPKGYVETFVDGPFAAFQRKATPKKVLALIAENERLLKEAKHWSDAHDRELEWSAQLIEEREALRADAERYRWLKECNGGPIGIVAWHRDEEKEMVLVEQYANEAIDAVMSKEPKS